MSVIMQINPFEFFTDAAGDALDAGYIYIGEVNKDPRQYPVAIYYDAALTIPAAMPLRTSGGYVVRNGSPTFLYVNGNYSIRVEDKKHRQIYYVPDFLFIGTNAAVTALDLANSTDPSKGAGLVGWTRAVLADKINTVHKALDAQEFNIWEFANLATGYTVGGNPLTWDWAPAFLAAFQSANNGRLVIPKSTYNTSPVYAVNTPIENLEIDFCDSQINCIGPRTLGTQFDWEYGVITFFGQDAGVSQTVTLSATLPATDNAWQVANSAAFADGDFWILEVDPSNTVDFSTKTVWRMLRVTKIDSATVVRFDYQRVFDIPSGTEVKFTKVNPVKNVRVKNLNLEYTLSYSGTAQNMLEASSGVSFYKAFDCHVENVKYTRNPKQAAHFEFTHSCSANDVRMIDPVETVSGGYNTQFEKSIYFLANKIQSSKERHVFDATASSNGMVSRSYGFDTANSSFTTHGTWEHDIEYVDNVGHFQLAGSGPDFGQTALRITVRNHVGTVLNVATNISDLTITNSQFASVSNINVDGLSLSNVKFLNDVRFTKVSSNSNRESEADGCAFKVGANFFNLPTSSRLTMRNCALPEMLNGALVGAGELILIECLCVNTGTSSAALAVPLGRLEVRGGLWHGLPILLADNTTDQNIVFNDCEVWLRNRPNTLPLVQTTKTGGSLFLSYAPKKSLTTGRHITANNVGVSAPTKIMLRDVELQDGTIQVQAPVIAGGWFMRDNVIYNGCVATLPAAGVRIGVGTELTI